ncbi:MAG: type II toxin-antitoxin system RelE/ParE family toxin [Patescibacteria group bacterium]
MEIAYKPTFLRQFKKLPLALQEEAFARIEQFRDPAAHSSLRVHKLKGELAGRYSFSVNYRYRIMFIWEVPNQSAVLLAIGDHSLYD